MAKRKQISKRIRFEIFKRDEFKCQYYGSTPPGVVLHVDHIVPVVEGGENDSDNLITSCSSCNIGKGGVPLNKIPRTLKEKALEIKEAEAQILGYHKIIEAKKERIEDECWEIADTLSPGSSENGYKKANLASIKNFVGRLGFYEVLEAAEIAYSRNLKNKNKVFLYFCGICWRKVREVANGQS